jgi:hypothetical protein
MTKHFAVAIIPVPEVSNDHSRLFSLKALISLSKLSAGQPRSLLKDSNSPQIPAKRWDSSKESTHE